VNKKFIVRLTPEDHDLLSLLISKGKTSTLKFRHAHILLKADQNGPAWTDQCIAEAFQCSVHTVANIRQRFVEDGVDAALQRRPQQSPSRSQLLDGEKEAKLIALSCGSPPEGRAKWTLQLLADKLVSLKIVEAVSGETVRTCLKKTRSSRI
jgi:transposase